MPGTQQAVVGRRVGGGFEIDSIVAAQREEALRIRARREREERIRAEQISSTLLHGVEDAIDSRASVVAPDVQPAKSPPLSPRHRPAPLVVPRQKLIANVTQNLTLNPLDSATQQKRRQTCNQMGFPALWSYAQTRVACEELSRGIGELAFAHGGEKVFSSPGVLQTYKELQLSCLQDPLLAPMVSRIQKYHDRTVTGNTSSHPASSHSLLGSTAEQGPSSNEASGTTKAGNDDCGGVDEDDRLGVERFALPPNELPEDMDPVLEPPVAVPAVEALETVLAFAALSTASEHRAMRGPQLQRLQQKRCSALYSLLLPECGAAAFRNIIDPKVPSEAVSISPAMEAIHMLFWFTYYAFFVPTKVEAFAWNIFPLLSEALMAIQMQAVTLRNHRLDETGAVGASSSVGVIEHTRNGSEPLDFLPFVLVHTVCFLFPVVFPASHDIFTVDFFNRSSMLMNLILTGVDSDALYWTAIRQSMFSAVETRVEDIANAAEVARMESNRMLQHYQDDVHQLRAQQETIERRQHERTEAMLRAAEGKAPVTQSSQAAGSSGSREVMQRRMERRSVASNVRASHLYCPPLDTMELGDPVLHLLNDAVFDPEFAQDVLRGRQDVERFGRHGGGVSTGGGTSLFRPRNKEEAHKFRDAITNKTFNGHRAMMRAAASMEIHERYRPSVYPASHRTEQSIMERNIATLRQQVADEETRVQSRSSTRRSSDVEDDAEDGGALTGGFVVRFTPRGVGCCADAEVLARSFRSICQVGMKRAQPSTASRRSQSPLQLAVNCHPKGATSLELQLSLFNGQPNVVDAQALTGSYAEPINRKSPHRSPRSESLISDLAAAASTAEDPAIEGHGTARISSVAGTSILRPLDCSSGAVFGDMLKSPQFGKRVKSFVTINSPSSSVTNDDDDDGENIVVDEEAATAVNVIADVLFPACSSPARASGERGGAHSEEVESSRDNYDDGDVSNVQAVGRRNKVAVIGASLLAERERDAPLALKSYLSLKRHESMVLSPKQGQNRSRGPLGFLPSRNDTKDTERVTFDNSQRSHSSADVRMSQSALSHALDAPSSIPSASSLLRPAPLRSPAALSRTGPTPGTAVVPNSRRSTTPSSRPNGTIVTAMNVSAMTPSSASIVHQPPGGSRAWTGLTYAVRKTQKYIDDAVRIHNAESEIKDMLSGQFERQRQHAELRKRALDRAFEDEMSQLRCRMADPLQRTLLVNDWIEREPSRCLPDRDKHSALLRGTLLAEEAQHTGMMVKEGLRKLEITFARRRKQSRMKKM